MRTTLDIDGKLLNEALALSKARTKKELVERSLGALIREMRIHRLIGKLGHLNLALTPRKLAKLRTDA